MTPRKRALIKCKDYWKPNPNPNMNTPTQQKTGLPRLTAEEAKANMREAYTSDGRFRSLSERREAQKQTAADAPEAPQAVEQWTEPLKREQRLTGYWEHDVELLLAQRDELLAACKGLFRECAMTHKYWGENCNRGKADEAIDAAKTAIANAEPQPRGEAFTRKGAK